MPRKIPKPLAVDRGHTTPCVIWRGAKNYSGYGIRVIAGKHRRVHVLAWIRHHGPIPKPPKGKRHVVMHECDQRDCFNIRHLLLGTHEDNMADMKAKGRGRSGQRRGEANTFAKLTDAQTAQIIELWSAGGKTQREIAAMFECSQSQVSRIVNGISRSVAA